ncbi:TPA: Ig domain-containing protein [Raoultella ornithinolytica]|uniref:Phage tail tube protein n=1 Tax=Raoultella ornithinolytica TaxID=54291 RepID=A0ABZ2E3C0_RAOOR|nr:Ig domain-containing protein [Raoultella ornithinolytica]HAT2346559.1 Ig domain-containing protein [Raoultella ornithinolytica]HAT2401779.1 Ig domain-containing protein [Raoultella ornithinolytica]HAT2439361.1 Ig domain-containing protein [Raoultella ornithinolytica]HAT2444969.1 Ig domain-containing protein [Raoultella ornithinolytica]
MSSGAKVVTAFIRETTPGVTPTVGVWDLLRRASFGLAPTQNTNDNDEIGGDRMAQGVSRGTIDVGGDVGTKFRWNQHDAFLASCFGAEWLNNVLTMGNSRITFSVASYAEDVGIAQIARGCQVATLQIEIPNDGDITATVTFAGLDWETKGDDTSYFTSPVDAAGALRYSFKEVTNIRLNGVDGGTGFCVDTFNIQFDNNMQTQRCIGTGSAFAGANIPTTFTPSGQVTLSWSKAAWELYKKTFTGETVPFSFTLENAEGAYTFDFPEVQISGDWPDAGSTDIVQVQLDITAANTPPTITRAPKVAATAISVAPLTSSGAIGSTVNLTATLTPADSSDIVEWTSSDPEIASVASTGQKTAQVTRNAAGTATITGKVRTFTATSAITVTAP